MTDTLAIMRDLETAGFERRQAEAIANALRNRVTGDVRLATWISGLTLALVLAGFAWLITTVFDNGERLTRLEERQATIIQNQTAIIQNQTAIVQRLDGIETWLQKIDDRLPPAP